MIKAQFDGGISTGMTGGWLKEQRDNQGYATVNVGELLPSGEIGRVRIFEFDDQGRLLQRMEGQRARLENQRLELTDLKRIIYPVISQPDQNVLLKEEHLNYFEWHTSIEPEMVSATLLNKQKMNTLDLYRVIQHLQTNKQNSQRQEIEFWSKLIYPLSCVVMALMALPFAYLHFRQSGVSLYVFVGIMLGISFFLLSNMFSYIGNIQGWSPWLAAASPSLLYVSLSMAAVAWRVLRR
jgi:lipopolysaccharide export system permease protein